MKISVVIPTYNSSLFIEQTLHSVFRQSIPPEEILVMDDGSTDGTISILKSYVPRIIIYKRGNRGVASARNELCNLARGELIAFLDHDDIWHPRYLEIQLRLFQAYKNAVAFFTGHVDFFGYGNYEWGETSRVVEAPVELISPLNFLMRYNRAVGPFASMSYCCIPRAIFKRIGPEPFSTRVSGADDFYFFNLLPLLGPIVFSAVPLVAYRITGKAQSENRIKSLALAIKAFELLETNYRATKDKELYKAFKMAFASKRRHYAKTLMGIGRSSDARKQLSLSLRTAINPISWAKSTTLLFLTYVPRFLQPKWPSNYRVGR